MSERRVTCDTSVLVPALLPAHVGFEACREAAQRVTVIPAHVLLETFRVLTALPGVDRVPAAVAAAALEALPWETVQLEAAATLPLISALAAANRGSGAVYDAHIAATCAAHDLLLLTRDQRAVPVYELCGAEYALV